MTPEGFTDLLLALTCLLLAWHLRRRSAGLQVALLVIGMAAGLGVARFEGADWALGPHRFAVIVAGTAALPLLAWSLRWPGSLPATQPRAACITIVFGGALGVILAGLSGITFWPLLCQAMALAGLVAAAWHRRHPRLVVGVLLLLGAGGVQVSGGVFAGLPATALLHLLLAAGLVAATTANDGVRH